MVLGSGFELLAEAVFNFVAFYALSTSLIPRSPHHPQHPVSASYSMQRRGWGRGGGGGGGGQGEFIT